MVSTILNGYFRSSSSTFIQIPGVRDCLITSGNCVQSHADVDALPNFSSRLLWHNPWNNYYLRSIRALHTFQLYFYLFPMMVSSLFKCWLGLAVNFALAELHPLVLPRGFVPAAVAEKSFKYLTTGFGLKLLWTLFEIIKITENRNALRNR